MNKKYFKNESGFSSVLIVLIVAVLVIGGYATYRWSSAPEVMEDKMVPKDDVMMEKTSSPTPDAMMELEFSGQILAGTKSPLLDFNKTDYDKAVASGKLVTLYFYANWCPICRAEFPKMQEAFNQITDDKVVGFRVNYNDDQTDNDEKELAREFGVAYQHTKVFVKNGQRLLKAPESWNSADIYISKINEYK